MHSEDYVHRIGPHRPRTRHRVDAISLCYAGKIQGPVRSLERFQSARGNRYGKRRGRFSDLQSGLRRPRDEQGRGGARSPASRKIEPRTTRKFLRVGSGRRPATAKIRVGVFRECLRRTTVPPRRSYRRHRLALGLGGAGRASGPGAARRRAEPPQRMLPCGS